MTTLAQIVEEDSALARRDERAYRCDVCKTAPGSAFFDTSWVCEGCREVLQVRLRLEPYLDVREGR